MDLGFETIGNATLICHDRGPLLATDPWLVGPAYFGSWTLSHRIPDEQLEAIRAARYLWISHGHPDHLSFESLELLRGVPILLPDHRGGRIAAGLREAGFDVRVLQDGRWTPLSDRVRVLCIGDYCQDAVLLIDMDGRLLVDSNDASDRGGGAFLRETARRFEESFLLSLSGYGDADMINFLDEEGRRILPGAAEKPATGKGISGVLEYYGIRRYVPFSTMHRYQRTDSAWANEYTTEVADFAVGFELEPERLLPGFVRYDLVTGEHARIDPEPVPGELHEPEEFGDSWSEELEPADVRELESYFGAIAHLSTFLGYLTFRVGGAEHTIDVARDRFERGISFEVPRGSLMTAVRHRVFDDLLIGNLSLIHI